jgi:hypothetical protein
MVVVGSVWILPYLLDIPPIKPLPMSRLNKVRGKDVGLFFSHSLAEGD